MISLKTKDWDISSIETVLFDKDGTFIDLHYFWGKMTEMRAQAIIDYFSLAEDYFGRICQFLGFDVNKKMMLSDGITALYSRAEIIRIFKENLKELGVVTTNENLELIFDNVSQEFYKKIVNYTKPIPEAVNLIKNLRKCGVKIGVVTSDSVESVNLTLKNFAWEELFDVVIGRESSSYTKESGEPTKLAMEKLRATPLNTIMIGDAPMDYISAVNAGIDRTILVATGQVNRVELSKISPFTVNDLSEIFIVKN